MLPTPRPLGMRDFREPTPNLAAGTMMGRFHSLSPDLEVEGMLGICSMQASSADTWEALQNQPISQGNIGNEEAERKAHERGF